MESFEPDSKIKIGLQKYIKDLQMERLDNYHDSEGQLFYHQ